MTRYQVAALALVASATVASAQQERRQVEVTRGTMEVVILREGGISDLLIGNNEIADALPLSDRRFAISAKKDGYTNVLVLNEARDVVARVDVSVVPPMPPVEDPRRPVTVWLPGGQNGMVRRHVYRCNPDDGVAPPQGMPCYFGNTEQNLQPAPIISTGPIIGGGPVISQPQK